MIHLINTDKKCEDLIAYPFIGIVGGLGKVAIGAAQIVAAIALALFSLITLAFYEKAKSLGIYSIKLIIKAPFKIVFGLLGIIPGIGTGLYLSYKKINSPQKQLLIQTPQHCEQPSITISKGWGRLPDELIRNITLYLECYEVINLSQTDNSNYKNSKFYLTVFKSYLEARSLIERNQFNDLNKFRKLFNQIDELQSKNRFSELIICTSRTTRQQRNISKEQITSIATMLLEYHPPLWIVSRVDNPTQNVTFDCLLKCQRGDLVAQNLSIDLLKSQVKGIADLFKYLPTLTKLLFNDLLNKINRNRDDSFQEFYDKILLLHDQICDFDNLFTIELIKSAKGMDNVGNETIEKYIGELRYIYLNALDNITDIRNLKLGITLNQEGNLVFNCHYFSTGVKLAIEFLKGLRNFLPEKQEINSEIIKKSIQATIQDYSLELSNLIFQEKMQSLVNQFMTRALEEGRDLNKLEKELSSLSGLA